LVALDVDGEIIVDEEDGDLAAFAFRARFQEEQFIHHAFVGTKADGVAKETGDGAEFAAIRAAAARLHGNDAEGAPAFADALKRVFHHFWNEIELGEVNFVPGDCGIFLEAGFAILAEGVDRSVDILEVAAFGIGDDPGPGFVGFAERDGVGVARAAVAAEGFVGFFVT